MYICVSHSGQPQQWPHSVGQGICMATPGDDACSIQSGYCVPDNRVACGAANPAVPLVHRHPCATDQWLDRQRYLHEICWQNGSTLSCFCGFFINGWGWGVHSNHVSHDPVHNLLVSQGSILTRCLDSETRRRFVLSWKESECSYSIKMGRLVTGARKG